MCLRRAASPIPAPASSPRPAPSAAPRAPARARPMTAPGPAWAATVVAGARLDGDVGTQLLATPPASGMPAWCRSAAPAHQRSDRASPRAPLSPSVPSICSKSAETFPWISVTLRAFEARPPRARHDDAARRSRRHAGQPACARSAPSRRCLRQHVRCDMYSPSRCSSSPTSPGFVHASSAAGASCTIRRLSSAVNFRRLACSTNSRSAPPPRRRARHPRIAARPRLADVRGRRQQPQPLPQPVGWGCPSPLVGVSSSSSSPRWLTRPR